MGTSATQLSRTEFRSSDQRSTPRKRLSPIRIELVPAIETWLENLSEGGIGIACSGRLELGSSAPARFQLPDAESPVVATGIVAWSDESGRAGLRFTHVEPASVSVLRRWLRNGAMAITPESLAGDSADTELANRVSSLNEVAGLQAVISEQNLDCAAALDLVARRMAELTRATGAAIALREGEDVVCRASFGNAPESGVRLSPTSLSGQCFQSATVVSLEDSEEDSRVNPEICRQLNFRSLLVIPVMSATESIGIAEVLSPNPHNFTGSDILVLSFLTDLITSIAAPVLEPDRTSVPDLAQYLVPPQIDDAEEEIEGIQEPFENLTASVSRNVSSENVVSQDVDEETPSISLDNPAAMVQSSRTVGLATEFAAAPRPTSMAQATIAVGRRESVVAAAASRTLKSVVPLAITVIVLLATAALLSGYYFSRSTSTKKQVPAPAVASTPASPNVVTAASKDAAVPAAASSAPARKTPSAPLVRKTTENASSATSPANEELQVIHGSARPVPVTTEAAPEAPAFANVAVQGNAQLPASIIAAKTATPELQPITSQGVTEGKLLKRVMPRYPEMARSAGVSGDVVISARIGVDGALHDLKVVSGSPLLRQAALEAAGQWRYSPYRLGGQPVETDTRITINFHR
ncbi:MAG: TonB family protein [Acidobacteria bacterium]|nr:TonB family protein [Acidobacteriota bacterium]MBV9148074.1 TonB family protein [Acidobacteriota bacterium]MBV9437037.1 TonB family protein [Acidobacteriota bacterium]